MQSETWIVIAVTVVIGIATILATRAWGNRRRRLLLTWTSTPLLPVGRADGPLQVTYRDFAVPDPHLVTVTIHNLGPTDVTTSHFDSGSNVVINLQATTFYGVTASSHSDTTLSQAVGSQDTRVEMRPMLLRKGEAWTVEAVVEGDADPVVTSPLIDTDISTRTLADQLTEILSGTEILLPGLGVTVRWSGRLARLASKPAPRSGTLRSP